MVQECTAHDDTRPHILITNDDGVQAPALLALKRELEPLGRVTIFAPERNWSVSGHSKTMHKPLRVRRVSLADGTPAFTTNGSPSDCVGLALLGLVQPCPTLVVSGINTGPNMGHDITYSGTVAAAMEATVFGVPAFAISVDSFEAEVDFGPAARFAARLAVHILQAGIPDNTFLNVNVPPIPEEEIHGVLFTRLGKRVYKDELVCRKDPRGQDYYWIGGAPPSGVAEDGTDIGAVAHGYISVTPLNLDMTDYAFLREMEGWRDILTIPSRAR